jgi:hypothetical protein
VLTALGNTGCTDSLNLYNRYLMRSTDVNRKRLMNHTKSLFQQQFLDAAVSRAKSEILADIASGTVPGGVGSFAALHDHVDANCYAGCCDESTRLELQGLDLWNSVFPGNANDGDEALGSGATLDAINEMQSRLDQWLASGSHRTPAGV